MSKFLTYMTLLLVSVGAFSQEGSYRLKYPSKLDNKRLTKSIAVVATAFTAQYSFYKNVYNDGRGFKQFDFSNDNKGYQQMDKFRHSFLSYVISYVAYDNYRKSGVSKNKSLWWGGTMGLLFMTQKEILDGIQNGGFSWGDMGANTFGSVLLMAQEHYWDEQIIQYKLSLNRSDESRTMPEMLGRSYKDLLFSDMNSYTLWFEINARRVIPSKYVPKWINLAVGYGAAGMYGTYENATSFNGKLIPKTERYRRFMLSFDIDTSKIKTKYEFLNTIIGTFRFIKFPLPTIEYNTKNGFNAYLFPKF